uniref:Uncharacterized protein n=1 Tax=Cannabis sativa TaxID=3483 RepID=A0A803QE48_CANSA
MGPWRSFNSQSKRSTSSEGTQNSGTGYEEPRMNICRPLSNLVGEDGAYDLTKYIPIVELENCQLRRRLEEANCRNTELERETAAATTTRENNTQNQPDPEERRPRDIPCNLRTRRHDPRLKILKRSISSVSFSRYRSNNTGE